MQHIEETHQKMIIGWASRQRLSELKHPVPPNSRIVDYLVASANGGNRSAREGGRLKASGVKGGFPDLQLCLACCGYHGLFIELKKPIVRGESKPVVSVLQKQWIERLNHAGYKAVVCYGFDDAVMAIKNYLSNNI